MDPEFSSTGRNPSKRSKCDVSGAMDIAAKVVKEKSRGRGKLAGLMNAPMDVLFEIFGHLRPLDILNLARVTKEFRRVLMHRSSVSVWKTVLKNVPGLPERPPDMTEPQWASLVFEQHCKVCMALVRSVDWKLRTRICAKCAKTHIAAYFPWISFTHPSDLAWSPKVVLTRPGKRQLHCYLIDDYKAVKAKYLSLDGDDARLAFIKEREEHVEELKAHLKRCEEWAEARAEDRSQELQQIRDDRRQAIIRELTVLGWGDEIMSIERPDVFENHELVKRPQALTARVWQNIEVQMIQYMEAMKTKRLAREFRALVIQRKTPAIIVLRIYKSHFPSSEIMPEPPDFCSLPAIKAVLERPREIEVKESSFFNVMPLFPSQIDEWRAGIIRMLLQKMEGIPTISVGNTPNDEPVDDAHFGTKLAELKLATTIFKCNDCHPDSYLAHTQIIYEPLFYPKVLGHRCLTQPSAHRYWDRDHDGMMKLDRGGYRRKWTCCQLSLDRWSGRIAKGIVEECGFNPYTTTADEMDELDPRLGCLSCSALTEPGLARVPTFGWRSAVKHQAEKHPRRIDIKVWRLLNLWEDFAARTCEQELLKYRYDQIANGNTYLDFPSDQISWSCVHCRDLPCERTPMELGELKRHIKDTHDISEPELDKDYYKNFAALQVYDNPEPFQLGSTTLHWESER